MPWLRAGPDGVDSTLGVKSTVKSRCYLRFKLELVCDSLVVGESIGRCLDRFFSPYKTGAAPLTAPQFVDAEGVPNSKETALRGIGQTKAEVKIDLLDLADHEFGLIMGWYPEETPRPLKSQNFSSSR
jgi:hypothetical protein